MFPRPTWFSGAELNFAENLLFPQIPEPPHEDAIAIITATEEGRDRKTWKELRERVRVYAAALARKVQAGDRVVGTTFSPTWDALGLGLINFTRIRGEPFRGVSGDVGCHLPRCDLVGCEVRFLETPGHGSPH